MKLFNAVGINLPNNIKAKYSLLNHNELFGLDKDNNILDPIIEYMIDNSNGAYVPHEKQDKWSTWLNKEKYIDYLAHTYETRHLQIDMI